MTDGAGSAAGTVAFAGAASGVDAGDEAGAGVGKGADVGACTGAASGEGPLFWLSEEQPANAAAVRSATRMRAIAFFMIMSHPLLNFLIISAMIIYFNGESQETSCAVARHDECTSWRRMKFY